MLGVIFTLLLSACSVLSSDMSTICASENPEKLFPHENCNQFYQCSNGVSVVHNCAAGLYFNEEQQVCDYADNVKCNSAAQEAIEVDEDVDLLKDAAVKRCAGDSSEGLLLPHKNCYQLYKCSHGVPHSLSCPEGLFFDPQLTVCDWAENVKCGSRKISPTNHDSVDNRNGTIPDELCAAEGSEGLLIPHEDCDKFYECNYGKPVEFNCPPLTLYDPATERCEWFEDVDCGDRNINNTIKLITANQNLPENGVKQESPASICAEEGSEGVLLPHENCSQFYECAGGHAFVLDCPEGLLYDIQKQRCEWANAVDCGDRKK